MEKKRTRGHQTFARDAESVSTQARMKKTSALLEKEHSRELLLGGTKHLGLFETLRMRLAGRADGRIGLPRKNDDGEWTSVVISREITAYEEYCAKTWGDLQIRLHWAHCRSNVLVEELLRLDEQIEEAMAAMNNVPTLSSDVRKQGEESLSDSQVAARRQRETERARIREKERLTRLRKEYEERFDELSLLHSFIAESGNEVRHICERVMDHTRQRIDVYWRAAFRVHPNNDSMPVVSMSLRQSGAESIYLENHEGHDSAIAAMLIQCRRRLDAAKKDIDAQKEAA